jgi:hypothetical protein
MARQEVEDRDCFRAFRLAARQVREASIIDEGLGVSIGGAVDESGALHETYELLSKEPFRSLAMSLRLVYANDEPGNFGRVCNRLRLAGDTSTVLAVDALRERYNGVLNGRLFQFNLHGQFEGSSLGPREIFETWLYHGSFHTDLERQGHFEELSRFGKRFVFAVQAIVLQLSGPILDLDDVLADFLGELRVPRIGLGEGSAA